MHIITIANQKGGTGKSTIAFNLAASLSINNNPTLLVDADPQGSVSTWAQVRIQHPHTKYHPNLTITNTSFDEEELLSLKQRRAYTTIIIDCGPANNKIIKTALAVSSLVLIPVSPSPLDIHSAQSTIELIRDGINCGAIKIQYHLIISKKRNGTNLAHEARPALKLLNVPILKTEISERVALCESVITGQSILEYAPHSPSAREFIGLGKEITQCLKRN
jgi:chromosome partitioning protein